LRSVEGGDSSPFADGPIRVVVADDHPSLRRNLRLLLEREDDLKVVGEAHDVESALAQVEAHRPRVLVLGLRLPGSSAERMQRLRERSPRTEVVVMTMTANRMFADAAFRDGAIGFVLTDSADVELCEAVRRAARGLPYTSPRLEPS
jgi:DNA-binding NarL/FixJ family response regulator